MEPEASAVTVSGAFPVAGETLRAGNGGWLGGDTEMLVLSVPDNAFEAVNLTILVPTSAAPSVQVRVPVVLPLPAANTAPGGRLAAVSDVMALPSGSAAETPRLRVVPA